MAQMRAVEMPDRAVNMNAAVRVIDAGEDEMGGPRLPVYVLAPADLKVNGGNFTLKGGKPIKMALSTVGRVLGGPCIPVYPVDANGNHDPSFAGCTYGPELLTNGGFETAGAGAPDFFGTWDENDFDDSTIEDSATSHGGTHAAKLTCGAGAGLVWLTNYVFGATPGTTYQLTFWTRGDGVAAGRYTVYDLTNAADIIPWSSTGVTGATYAQFSVAFTLPAGCVTFSLSCRAPATPGGIAYFDDVSVKEVIC